MLLDVGGEVYKSTWQTLSGSRVLQSLAVGGAEREIFIDRDGQVRPPLTSEPCVAHRCIADALLNIHSVRHADSLACLRHVHRLQAAVGYHKASDCAPWPRGHVKSPHPCATWEPLPL